MVVTSLRKLYLFIALFSVALLLPVTVAHAETVTAEINGLSFSVDTENREASVTGYNKLHGSNVIIPDHIVLNAETYTVTSISGYAFYVKELSSVSIPDSVEKIGDFAFAWNNLEEVVIPESVKYIGASAFRINKLKNIIIPGSVETIRDYTFANNALTEVSLLNGLRHIGSRAFWGNNITNISLPESLVSIGSDAFQENKLTELILPTSLNTIAERAFYKNNLTTIIFPDSLEKIGHAAFAENLLSQLKLPNSLIELESHAFYRNKLLTIDLPESLKIIGIAAFADNNLTDVSIPAAVENIGNLAFVENPNLENIWFLGNAPQITPGQSNGAGSFGKPTGKTIYFPATATGYTEPLWRGYESDKYQISHTVTLVSYDEFVDVLSIADGDLIPLPTEPYRPGYKFTGWFVQHNGEFVSYNFATPVTKNLILHAGWDIEAAPEPVQETPDPVQETPDPVQETPDPVQETPDPVDPVANITEPILPIPVANVPVDSTQHNGSDTSLNKSTVPVLPIRVVEETTFSRELFASTPDSSPVEKTAKTETPMPAQPAVNRDDSTPQKSPNNSALNAENASYELGITFSWLFWAVLFIFLAFFFLYVARKKYNNRNVD